MSWLRPQRLPTLVLVLIVLTVTGCGEDALGPDSARQVAVFDESRVDAGKVITIHHYTNVTLRPGHLVIPEGQPGAKLIDHTGVFFVGRGGSKACPYDDTYTLGQFLPTPEEHGEKFDRHFFQVAYEGASATFDLGSRNDVLIIALTQDHGPYPEEALEYRVATSDSPTGPFEEMPGNRPIRIYRGGWSTAGEPGGDCDGNGVLNDDFVVEWDLPWARRYVKITPLETDSAYNEPEIDAVMGMRYMPDRVDLDILPAECPNDLNVVKRPVMRVAVLGAPGFRVQDIDLSTVNLAGALPLRTGFFDVAAPTVDGAEGDCTAAGPDGYEDLVMEFLAMDVVNCLGRVHVEDEVAKLILRGSRTDQTRFYGADQVALHGMPECVQGPK